MNSRDDYQGLINRSYCITAHMMERLDELRELDFITKFSQVAGETIITLEVQLNNIRDYYGLSDGDCTAAKNMALIGYLENLFSLIHSPKKGVSAFNILSYLSIADAMLFENNKLADLLTIRNPTLRITESKLHQYATLQPLKNLLTSYIFGI